MTADAGADPRGAGGAWPWAATAAGGALLLARAAHLWNPYLLVDDAFVSFRYARNLAEGHGLVYNLGERVEGYTNFLWTLLLAGGAALGLDLPLLSMVLAAAAGVMAVALVARLARWALPEQGVLAALPPLLFAALGSQPRFVVSGLETLLFVALLLLALERLLVAGRPAAAGAVFALAAMTRPEGGLYWLVTLPFSSRRRSLVATLSFLVLYLPYFIWRWTYYGWLLPNTFYVKASGFAWERSARAVPQLLELADRWNALPLALLAIGSLVLTPAAARRGRWVGLAWTWIAATLAYFFWVGGDFLPFFGPRFLLPALPPLLLLAAVGLGALTGGLLPAARGALRGAVVTALVATALWLSWPERLSRLDGQAYEIESWTRVGHWLRENTAPQAVIATGGAGIVPFYSRRWTIDMFGLTDEHIAHLPPPTVGFRQTAHDKFAPDYVLDRRPDLLLSRLTRSGRPTTAGLGLAAARVRACYVPLLLIKVRGARPPEDEWLLFTNRPTPELHAAGYETAVLRRRRGDAAAGCRAMERRRRAMRAGGG
jgi:hypothetical protein